MGPTFCPHTKHLRFLADLRENANWITPKGAHNGFEWSENIFWTNFCKTFRNQNGLLLL